MTEQLPPSPDFRPTLEQGALTQLVEHARVIRRYTGICAVVLAALGVLYVLAFLVAIIATSA